MFNVFDHHCIQIFEQIAKEDYLELRQEASDLQEYSNAKLDRVTRYLGVLAEKTRKLGEKLSSSVTSMVHTQYFLKSLIFPLWRLLDLI